MEGIPSGQPTENERTPMQRETNLEFDEDLASVQPSGTPLLKLNFTSGKDSSGELYKKNLCSVLVGFTLVFLALTILGLSLIILTNPEIYSSEESKRPANHIRIALNKYYQESYPDFWMLNSGGQLDRSIFLHQVDPGRSRWRKVHRREQWTWTRGGSVTVHTVENGSNYSSFISGDALLLRGEFHMSFTVLPGSWICLEIPEHSAHYSLLQLVSKQDFYQNSTNDAKTGLVNIYPDYTTISDEII